MSLRSTDDGGYAALVFLVCRAADDPDRYLGLLRDWSSIHDVTGRYLGVITPMVKGSILVGGPYPGGRWAAVPDLALFGERDRLRAVSSRSVRLVKGDPPGKVFAAPYPVDSDQRHETALSTVVSELQTFFGIAESMVPCAVVVSLQERTALAVELPGSTTVYQLLKSIKSRIEPLATEINRKEAELAKMKIGGVTVSKLERFERAVGGIHREWDHHRASIARRLAEAASGRGSEERSLCEWLAVRLESPERLTDEEELMARRLLDLMHTGKFGTPRLVRRVLKKLRSGYPRGNPRYEGMVKGTAAENPGFLAELRKLKAELVALHSGFRISDATLAVGEELGLENAGTTGLLEWRQFQWPVTVLARPSRSPFAARLGRA
ncbi:hypothetical protein [Amycolatopsis speibonae]|uniref:Uncharacterized protein n=1 Tax=Amycolatopsis speibonae TaxID=1450224 RepID=A0ABV7P5M3_9PSEU